MQPSAASSLTVSFFLSLWQPQLSAQLFTLLNIPKVDDFVLGKGKASDVGQQACGPCFPLPLVLC